MKNNWIVIKFGGTSVSSLANWKNIAFIIRQHLAASRRILVVCSAITRISNQLDAVLSAALRGDQLPLLKEIEMSHRRLCEELGVDFAIIASYFNQLVQWVEGVSLILEVTPRVRAQVMALGELMSTKLGAAYLQAQQQIPVHWQDARELLRVEEDPHAHHSAAYLMARCSTETDNDLISQLNSLPGVIITQGFIAYNHKRETVLLGRGGSDTSASYFAAKINAIGCEIWTDVPGIYTANPHQISEARLLLQLDYDEAQEIASMGGKVLHPNCISPVKQQQIPLYVKCTAYPERAGTKITLTSDKSAVQIKSVLCKYGILLISIETVRMWQQVGFLAQVFSCFKQRGLSIDLVSTSESNVTVSLDMQATASDLTIIDLLLQDLNVFAKARMIGPCAAISLIGHHIRASLYKLGEIFSVFEQHPVHMLSQAANDLNLTFVVDEDQAERIAQKIHALLIEKNPAAGCFSQSWIEEFGTSIRPDRSPWWQRRRTELINLIAQQKNPLYVYEASCLQHNAQQLLNCKSIDRIFYSMKANHYAPILQHFYQMGLGFECVSLTEIHEALRLFPNIDRSRLLFTPNFAPREEYEQALAAKVWVTLDSLYPLQYWPEVFANQTVLIRVDPGQGHGHHRYVCTAGTQSKFGIPLTELPLVLNLAKVHNIRIIGLHTHVGSGIFRTQTWQENFAALVQILDQFPDVKYVNLGGGLGVNEKPGEHPLNIQAVDESLMQVKAAFSSLQIWMEPGRYLVAEAGVLLARVTQVKEKNDVLFIGIETGMNSLLRPSLYGSYHEIVNLTRLEEKNL